MRLHSVLIATVALAFGGVIQASAAAPETQVGSAPTKSATAAAATNAPGNTAKSVKYVAAFKLMTPEERKAFREKMRSLKTPQEREAFRKEHRKLMETRAAERGEKLRPEISREEMQARAAAQEQKMKAQPQKDAAAADQHPAH